MNEAREPDLIVGKDDCILVTGATGFIGTRLVRALLDRGFGNLRCFARPSAGLARIESEWRQHANGKWLEVVEGNLLSMEDCVAATKGANVIFHLAAGRGEKSIPDAYMNSVVATRNLLESSRQHHCLRRFVNISSFTVYTNQNNSHGRLLDESCPVDRRPELRGEAYTFAKVKQDEIVAEYSARFGIPYVIIRPGVVYGPGNEAITGRVGIGTFGLFLHLGGANTIPFTYVDNCAEAILLSGLKRGVDGEVFNVVDDDLPSARKFLHLYKKNVRRFKSVYIPHFLSYTLCYLWERYVNWSEGQLPPAFNRSRWHANWKKTRYSNCKLKTRLSWTQAVPTREGLNRYFESCRAKVSHA